MTASIVRKNFFLAGNPSVGKTSLIKEIIQTCPEKFGGFYTEQILKATSISAGGGEGGYRQQREGFIIKTIPEGKSVLFASKNPDGIAAKPLLRFNKYYVDLNALEKTAIPSVDRALEENKIAVIDEIGSMEILSDTFRIKIIEWLSSDSKILATIRFNSKPFTDELKKRADTEVIILRPDNMAFVKNLLIHRLDLNLP